jgi:hypothetical protein
VQEIHSFTPALGEETQGRLPAVAAHSAQAYYVGIIDILQTWNGSKQAEMWGKALWGHDWDEISAVEPEWYQKRFMHRIRQRLEPILGGNPILSSMVHGVEKTLELNKRQSRILAGLVEGTTNPTEALGAMSATNLTAQSSGSSAGSIVSQEIGLRARVLSNSVAQEPEPELDSEC